MCDHDTISFDAIIAEFEDAERDPNTPTIDPAHFLETEPLSWSGATHKYRVKIPVGYEDITDAELITRCDNRTSILTEDMGQKCHFGGWVERIDPNNAEVSVCVD